MNVRVAVVSVTSDGFSPIPCLNCDHPLDVHQPDPDLPERMLGTCDACKAWHVVRCEAGGDSVVVVGWPDPPLDELPPAGGDAG